MVQYLTHPVQHSEPSQIQYHCTSEFCDSTEKDEHSLFLLFLGVWKKILCKHNSDTNKSAPEDPLLHIPVPSSSYLTISSTVKIGPTVSRSCPQLKPEEVSWKLFFCPRYTQTTIVTWQHF